MILNRELSKKYKKILLSMPSFTEEGWHEQDRWEITIKGFRLYEDDENRFKYYEIDIEYSGTFRWSWQSTRSKNSTIRSKSEKTIKRYLTYLGIDTRFGLDPRFYGSAAKVSKITFVNQSPSIGG